MSQDDRSNYNSMQQSAGIVPQMNLPQQYVPSSAQTSAQIAAMGAIQLQSMMAVTQLGQQQMGPFGSPSFPQLQTPFVGMPGVMPGPGGSYYPMTPAGASSPYAGSMGSYNQMGMAGQMSSPGSPYAPTASMPPPAYRGAMGQPGFAPFSPPPPPSMFDTPYMGAVAQSSATADRAFAGMSTGMGMGARLAADAGMGMLGARIGNRMGGRAGAMVGGALGFLGSEVSGIGNFAQNSFTENVTMPAMNTRAYGTGLEHISRGFVAGGPELGSAGVGWGHHASARAAGGLQDLAQSSSFQRETGNRFNTADVMRIAQGAGQEGLLSGVQTGADLKPRVKEISKALTSFMELANEPDVMRALQVMGQIRTSGLSLSETTQAVQHGRAFARMAGTSFENLSNSGGAMGSAAYQSLGLTQGVGMRSGMANTGIALASQNSARLSPQTLNLLGGAHGLAGMNTMFSAGMLQMPMMAPGMMTGQGGISPDAIRQMMSGQMGAFGMTGRGASNMAQMGREMGVGGLGMALGMQPMLQDTIGRMVQSQGPFAQRHMEDRQMMSLMRNMGLRGSEGFMTAAQMMGMNGTQAMARAQELGDPRHFETERQQIEINRRDRRAEELRGHEAAEPGFGEEAQFRYGAAASVGRFGRSISRGLSRFSRGLAGGGPAAYYAPTSRDEVRRSRSAARSAEYWQGGAGETEGEGLTSYLDRATGIGEMHGGRGVIATVGGLLRGNSEGEARAFRETGRFLSTALNSSGQSRRTALARADETFGGHRQLDEYSAGVAQMYGSDNRGMFGGLGGGAANLVVRAGGESLSRHMLDVGNVAGSRVNTLDQFRALYVRQQSGRLGGAEAAGRHFDTNRSTIATQMGDRAGDFMNPEERAKMTRDMTAASNLTVGGRHRDPEAAERDAYRGILGNNAGNRDSRRRVDQLFQFTGFGNNDRERDSSAQYMAGRAALQVQLASETDDGRKQQIRRRMIELTEEGRRRGIDTQRADERVRSRRDEFQRDGNLRDDLHGVNLGNTGREVFDRIGQVRTAREDASRVTRRNDALRMLGNQDGALGSAFRGVTNEDGSVNAERLRGQIGNIAGDEGKMRELAARDPRLAEAFRRVGSGNARDAERGMADIGSYVDAQGSRGAQLRNQFRERGAGGRAVDRIRQGGLTLGNIMGGFIGRGIMGMAESEDSYVAARSGGGTRADADALRQTGDSAAAEGEAREAGIGGAADKLSRASDQLVRAAELLSNNANQDQMNGIFPQGR